MASRKLKNNFKKMKNALKLKRFKKPENSSINNSSTELF